jgi:hypothetical protein
MIERIASTIEPQPMPDHSVQPAGLNREIARATYTIAVEHARYEGALLWQVFGAFLLAHTVLMVLIGQSLARDHHWFDSEPVAFVGSIFGTLMFLPWFTSFQRNSAYYKLRMAQARQAEKELNLPDTWWLIAGEAPAFSQGAGVDVAGRHHRIPPPARWFNTQYAAGAMPWLFLAAYIASAIHTFP